MSNDFFEVFIPVPADEKIASAIRSHADSIKSYKVTLIEESEIYAAMCASDFGVLHNGEITV